MERWCFLQEAVAALRATAAAATEAEAEAEAGAGAVGTFEASQRGSVRARAPGHQTGSRNIRNRTSDFDSESESDSDSESSSEPIERHAAALGTVGPSPAKFNETRDRGPLQSENERSGTSIAWVPDQSRHPASGSSTV